MTRAPFALTLLCLVAPVAPSARADEPATAGSTTTTTADAHLARARDLYAHGDYAHSRDELLLAYNLDPRPELLFALGQVEFNLAHYQQAITYYQRFLATGPAADQTALAQQAIGAARIELSKPPPAAAVRPPHLEPHWDTTDAGLAALGGLAAIVGGGLLYDSYRLGNDRSGTLRDYDLRIHNAQTTRFAGIACLGGGAIAIGAAFVRWRFHLVDSTIAVEPTSGGASVTIGGSL